MPFQIHGLPQLGIIIIYRSSAHFFPLPLPWMARPARGTALLARHAPAAAATLRRGSATPLDPLPPKRHRTASAELAFRGSDSQRSTPRLALPAPPPPRPLDPSATLPGEIGLSTRRRRRTSTRTVPGDAWGRRQRPRSAAAHCSGSPPVGPAVVIAAFASSRLFVSHASPAPVAPSRPHGPPPVATRTPRPVAARPQRRRASRPHPPLLLVAARGRRRPLWGMRVT